MLIVAAAIPTPMARVSPTRLPAIASRPFGLAERCAQK